MRIVTSLVAAALVALPAASAMAKPAIPGNAGTVKVDGIAFDNHPNNEPHVGCTFEIDFDGFGQGDLYGDVEFSAHPPTGTGVLLTDSVFIGEDAAGGATDNDASVEYDLSFELSSYDPHPKQGYHVKLTVTTPNGPKHKVFWVRDCEPPTPEAAEFELM